MKESEQTEKTIQDRNDSNLGANQKGFGTFF